MSSFVLLTKDGLPDLTVEVGNKLSKDPVLLSGLFKAIYTFSNEVTESPLQMIQMKGFTIKFLSFTEGFILIVGTNKNVANLNNLIDQVSIIIINALQLNKELYLLEEQTKILLVNSLESEYMLQMTDEIEVMGDMFEDLNSDILKLFFWGLLTGKHVHPPRTKSLDFNNYIRKLLDFLGYEACIKEDCKLGIIFTNKKGDYQIDDQQFSLKKKKYGTSKILKKIIKLGKKKKFKDLQVYFTSLISTITGVVEMSIKSNLSEKDLKDINLTRHMIGMELEHYALEHLKLASKSAYEVVKNSTDELEWITSWEI